MNGNPRRRLLGAAVAGIGAAIGPAARAQPLAPAPYRLGLAPFLSPAAMVAAFKPLREHLEARLRRPVEIYTARDLPSMVAATQRGEYDVAMLPAHLARLAVTDWRSSLLVGTLAAVRVLILVRRESTLRQASDLKGRRLGAFDRLSIVGATALAWMRAQRLVAGTDFEFVAHPSINSAVFALNLGEIDALAIAQSQVSALPAGTPRDDRVLAEAGDIPGPMYVARGELSASEQGAWRDAFLSFVPQADRPSTASNVRPHGVPPEVFSRLDPLADEARRLLAHRP